MLSSFRNGSLVLKILHIFLPQRMPRSSRMRLETKKPAPWVLTVINTSRFHISSMSLDYHPNHPTIRKHNYSFFLSGVAARFTSLMKSLAASHCCWRSAEIAERSFCKFNCCAYECFNCEDWAAFCREMFAQRVF